MQKKQHIINYCNLATTLSTPTTVDSRITTMMPTQTIVMTTVNAKPIVSAVTTAHTTTTTSAIPGQCPPFDINMCSPDCVSIDAMGCLHCNCKPTGKETYIAL